MPLLDHFHPPLGTRRPWEGFHSAWAVFIAGSLNRALPEGYSADPNTHAGPNIEIDVAAWEEADGGNVRAAVRANNGAVATLTQPHAYAPPAPARTISAAFNDDVEIRVISHRHESRLVGAIELVSPRNKDRSEARQAFAVKCASLLAQGVGLIVVDIVTDRQTSLHELTMSLLPNSGGSLFPADARLYAVAHRPVRRAGVEEIDLWGEVLTLGCHLPTLPLWLSADLCLPVDLEATYTRAREEMGV